MDEVVRIPSRFNGPPHSANGGYVAGLLAAAAAQRLPSGADPVITLHAPPPLDLPLAVRAVPPRVHLWDGDRLLASASAGSVRSEPPAAVSWSAAEAAQADYRGRHGHPFPTCFACGVARPDATGLRLEPGLLTGSTGRTACTWIPDATIAADPDPDPGPPVDPGAVDWAVVWSVLDCVGGWTDDPVARPAVLGRMTAAVLRPLRVGGRYIVTGEATGSRGEGSMLGSTSAHTALSNDGGVSLIDTEHPAAGERCGHD